MRPIKVIAIVMMVIMSMSHGVSSFFLSFFLFSVEEKHNEMKQNQPPLRKHFLIAAGSNYEEKANIAFEAEKLMLLKLTNM